MLKSLIIFLKTFPSVVAQSVSRSALGVGLILCQILIMPMSSVPFKDVNNV